MKLKSQAYTDLNIREIENILETVKGDQPHRVAYLNACYSLIIQTRDAIQTPKQAAVAAAAPELLEALQLIRDRHQATAELMGHSILYEADISRIVAAIAKAEGR